MPEAGSSAERALERFVEDGLLRRDDGALRTTARFQAALARAAWALLQAGTPWRDLRLPIAGALAERYPDEPDEELAGMVEAMLRVEERELAPLAQTGVISTR